MVLKPGYWDLQEALTNNTFDIDATDKAARMAFHNSYQYLYRLQKNMACYEEYFYTTRNNVDEREYGDFYLDDREKVLVNYPLELVPVHFREKFRMSEYYGKVIPYQTIIDNDKLFTKLPIIIVDDQVVRDCGIEVFDDHITVHLGFDRYFLFVKNFNGTTWGYDYIQHKHSVHLIDNAGVENIQTNSGMIKFNSYSGNDFDRLKKDYLKGFNIKLQPPSEGLYMAVIFIGDNKTGSHLIEAETDENGDIVIRYHDELIGVLNNTNKPILIKLYFFKGLHKAVSCRKNGNAVDKMIRIVQRRNSPYSENFLITDENGRPHDHLIPEENFMLFKEKGTALYNRNPATTIVPTGVYAHPTHLAYITTDDVNIGDRFNVFYFYTKPAEYKVSNRFWFLFRYFKYRWKGLSIDTIVNVIDCGVLEPLQDTNGNLKPEYEDLFKLAALYHTGLYVNREIFFIPQPGYISRKYRASLYQYLSTWVPYLQNFNQRVAEFMDIKETIDWVSAVIPDDIDSLERVVYDFLFWYFNESFYDEMDYLMEYEAASHPFQYKVDRLKEFIEDDPLNLKNYVKLQNKIIVKYEFAAIDINLQSKYRTEYDDGRPLREPMYVFHIKRNDPDDPIAARIWIDGLLCTTFVIDNCEYMDMYYIPANMITEKSYIEIEEFHYYEALATVRFTTETPYVDVEFPIAKNTKPTLSDLFFYLKTEGAEGERIDISAFNMEVITDRYNYYVDPDTPVNLFYKDITDDINQGPYYDSQGKYYSADGFPDSTKDISIDTLNEKKDSGELTEEAGYLTDNKLEIHRLEDIVKYTQVYEGESVLDEGRDGVLYSDLTKIRITLTDESLFGQDICIEIKKRPFYSGGRLNTIAYPSFSRHIPNWENVEDYTRVFRNGRLMGKNRYAFHDYLHGMVNIQILERLNRGNTYAFDVTPFRNKLIYYREQLESDMIDLRGIIDKPFDPSFYEVYLNGRRLNRTNLFPISAWEVRLVGIHSMKNFEIYERDRDWEYYGVDLSEYYYTVSDFLREPFIDPDIGKKIIDDITKEQIPPWMIPGYDPDNPDDTPKYDPDDPRYDPDSPEYDPENPGFPDIPIPPNDEEEDEPGYDDGFDEGGGSDDFGDPNDPENPDRPDPGDEPIDDWDKILDEVSLYIDMFYYTKLVPMQYVTGDMIQFMSEEIKTKYPIIYSMFKVDATKDMQVILLSPDNWYAGDSTLNEDGTITRGETPADVTRGWMVYRLGNSRPSAIMQSDDNDYWKGD